MKKLILPILFLFLFMSSNAQEITESFLPEIGDKHSYKSFNSFDSIPLDSGGLDMVWDYSQLTWDTLANIEYLYVDAESLDTNDVFTDATIAFVFGANTQNVTFLQKEGSWFFYMGNRDPEAYSRFNPPIAQFRFPLNYQEEVVADGTINLYATDVSITNYYESERTFDGIGTLITPDGTYEDCVRIKEVYKSSSDPAFEFPSITTRHIWYKDKISNTMAIHGRRGNEPFISYGFVWQTNVNDMASSNETVEKDYKITYLQNGNFELSIPPGNYQAEVYAIGGQKICSKQITQHSAKSFAQFEFSSEHKAQMHFLLLWNHETDRFYVRKFIP